MDLVAVRTFVAAADAGQFSDAAADLSITQQAVSKRIAALEKDLGARLFTRTPRGAELTIDGHTFLPHARDLLQAAERAAASVRPGRRALRVDVVGRRLAPAALLRDFHQAHPQTELDVVRIWMPEIVPGTEWAAFYDELATAFGLTIEINGPDFGTGPVLDTIAGSAALATFVGERTHLVWPAHWDLRRVAVRDPVPAYPHSLIWRVGNRHPGLAALRSYLDDARPRRTAGTWTPTWARQLTRKELL